MSENVLITLTMNQIDDTKLNISCDLKPTEGNKNAIISSFGLAVLMRTLWSRIVENVPEDKKEDYIAGYKNSIEHMQKADEAGATCTCGENCERVDKVDTGYCGISA